MSAPLVKYAFFFHLILFVSLSKVKFSKVWIIIQVFYLVPLFLLSVFMLIPGCFQYYSSVVEFEVRDCDASRCSFIVQGCLGHTGFFAFPYEVKYHSFLVSEDFCWSFNGYYIESIDFI